VLLRRVCVSANPGNQANILVILETPQLFYIQEDPLEINDFAAAKPELIYTLQARLSNWDFAEDPGILFINVMFDPDYFGGEEGRAPWSEVVQ
jgi:hypothetical protein